ncbi:MAG TPA: non-heme iron oxygenase ferredoxin subunit [Polyangia bacterium]|jgi:3-phenylpropionate/trans-cinnamate dioxygenase ferredoxin subunit|nr:non-heme iron oxygenase ferredoxin subunit [Polyangia bacterium]
MDRDPDQGAFVRVARLSELGEGEVRGVEAGGRRIALVRLGDTVCAIGDDCSHDEALLSEGRLEGEVLRCPWHGARFDVRTGRALALPAVDDVPCYRVRLRGDDVEVAID